MTRRYLGLDIGAERVKVAEVILSGQAVTAGGCWERDHHKDPTAALDKLLTEIGWDDVAGAAVTGRLAGLLRLERVPLKAAAAEGLPLLHGEAAGFTVVSIGSHGFAVVELHPGGVTRVRENSRCSQGTGNFLRQLVERFGLTLAEADALCDAVDDPAPLSGRCPVILKTDMTHLANRGEQRARILAGLYDAVCENVQALVKPTPGMKRLLLIGGVCRSERIRRHFARAAERLGMQLVAGNPERDLFLEAFGAAVVAARRQVAAPELAQLFAKTESVDLEKIPSLTEALGMVRRMPAPQLAVAPAAAVILGLDIGSTGSKALAFDLEQQQPVWERLYLHPGRPGERRPATGGSACATRPPQRHAV